MWPDLMRDMNRQKVQREGIHASLVTEPEIPPIDIRLLSYTVYVNATNRESTPERSCSGMGEDPGK